MDYMVQHVETTDHYHRLVAPAHPGAQHIRRVTPPLSMLYTIAQQIRRVKRF